MKINFSKYEGAGNDFVLLNGKTIQTLESSIIKKICNRHFGIGADGLIVIKENTNADFEMVYYNADGNLGSMCGNGSRCAAVFSLEQQIIKSNRTKFKASDGIHSAEIFSGGEVKISMTDVNSWRFSDNDFITNTGSPHYVKYVSGLEKMNIVEEAKKIRYNNEFSTTGGINVNFVEEADKQLYMRTYERGVEDETLACGTGTVAVAISSRFLMGKPIEGNFEVSIKAIGGDLKVMGEYVDGLFKNLYLIGPVKKVFEGSFEID